MAKIGLFAIYWYVLRNIVYAFPTNCIKCGDKSRLQAEKETPRVMFKFKTKKILFSFAVRSLIRNFD